MMHYDTKVLTNVYIWFVNFQMTSVERINEYGNLTPEAPEHTDHPIPSNWPTEGVVVFDNVCLFYDRNIQPALKNVTFKIMQNEKVSPINIFSLKFKLCNFCYDIRLGIN